MKYTFLYICKYNIKLMKKINYLFTGILATAILFAGCSTQTKYTAFGGGWGMEKNKGFQNPNPTAKNTNETKNQVTSDAETITVNEAIAQNESKLTPEVKSYIAKHKEQLSKIANKKLSSATVNKIENKFTKNSTAQKSLNNKSQKTASSGSMDDEQLIAILLCVLLGGLGIHRFYLGYTMEGVIQLLTGGGCGIWALIDLIRLITGDLKRKR